MSIQIAILVIIVLVGHVPVSEQIAGGTTLDDDKAGAFVVSILNADHTKHFCGGSIIADEWVITTKRCLAPDGSKPVVVHAGSNQKLTGGVFIDVALTIPHPTQNVGLIKLATKLTFSDTIKKVEIQNPELGTTGYTWAYGWGVSDVPLDAAKKNTLAKRHVFIATNKDLCKDSYAKYSYPGWTLRVEPQDLCGGWYGDQEGQTKGVGCTGDQGGPLVDNAYYQPLDSRPMLYAMMSWGAGCGLKNYPTNFIEIKPLLPWIKENSAVEPIPKPAPQGE